MKIVIIGCGRVGSLLARRFVEQGHKVSVVDKERLAFQRLGDSFAGKTVLGLGFDEDVLKKAGIQEADVFVAFTGGDNSNLMGAQIAKDKYHIRKVVARVKDPLRAEVYKEMGLQTFCSTVFGATILEDAILGRPFRTVEEYLGMSAVRAQDDSDADGSAIVEKDESDSEVSATVESMLES